MAALEIAATTQADNSVTVIEELAREIWAVEVSGFSA
jgi:hypothetical protein